MAQAGIIKSITGIVTALNPQGESRQLQVGNIVYENEIINTDSGASASIELDNGQVINLAENAQALLDESVTGPVDAGDAVFEQVEALQAALEEGEDIDEDEETAAGEEDDGFDYDLAYAAGDQSGGDVGSYLFGTEYGVVSEVPPDDPGTVEEAIPTSAIVTLSAPESAYESDDGVITYTATVDNAPITDITVSLDNGLIIIIPAGAASGVGILPIQSDDVYLDPGPVEASISDVSGGGLGAIGFDPTPVTTEILDTINDTTVSLTANPDVLEGDNVITYTATVNNPPQSDITVTLSNGEVISILNGETSGFVTVPVQGDDVYNDPSIESVTIVNADSDNYENLVIDPRPAVTNIGDTINTTTVILDDVTMDEVGTIIYTASVDNAPQGPFTVTLNNGVVINFADGALTGSSAPQAAQGDDPYVDGDSFTVSVAGTSGGNYEAVDTTDTALVTITDTIDTTTLTLGNVEYLEGTTDAFITATLDHTPETELVVTLSNGETITFGTDYVAGDEVRSSLFEIPVTQHGAPGTQTDTSVAEPVTVSGTNGGGNFENLTVVAGSITILDDVPTASLSLDATGLTVSETGGIAQFQMDLEEIPTPGADGLANEEYSLRLVAGDGVDSGLMTTSEETIYLYQLADNTIVGSTMTSAPNDITDESVTFSLVVDTDDGTVTMQSQGIYHDRLTSDTMAYMTAEIQAVYTVTDGDNDTAEATANLATYVGFEDGVPTLGAFAPLYMANEANLTATGTVELDGVADGIANIDVAIPNLPADWSIDPETDIFRADGAYDHTDVVVRNADGERYGTFTIDADGAYAFTLETPTEPSYNTASLINVTAGQPEDPVYLAVLSPDGSTYVNATFTSPGAAQINSSTQGMGVDNNMVDGAGEVVDIAFDESLTDIGFTVGNLRNTGGNKVETLTWTVYDDTGDALASGTYTPPFGTGESDDVSFVLSDLSAWFDGNHTFDAVLLSADGTDDYRLLNISVATTEPPAEVSLDFAVTAYDGDGDPTGMEALSLTVSGDGGPVFTINQSDSDEGVQIHGGSEADILTGSDYNDVIDGGEGSDTINAGGGDDIIVFDKDDSSIDGGAGFDTLLVHDTSGTLDFSRISNVEAVDLNEDGTNQDVTLNLDQVLDIVGNGGTLEVAGGDTGDIIRFNDGDTADGETAQWTSSDNGDGSFTFTHVDLSRTVNVVQVDDADNHIQVDGNIDI